MVGLDGHRCSPASVTAWYDAQRHIIHGPEIFSHGGSIMSEQTQLYDIQIERGVSVPMRDGVALTATV